MLTPEFVLHQDKDFVFVTIRAPYVKISEVDWVIDGPTFRFHVSPYFLRLCFDEDLIEDGREKAQYDVDTSQFFITLPKKSPGHFENLDMQTLLLSRKQQQKVQRNGTAKKDSFQHQQQDVEDQLGSRNSGHPLIEVISSEEFDQDIPNISAISAPEGEIPEDFDWEIEQSPPEPLFISEGVPYGFDLKYSGTLSKLQQEIPDITMLIDPDQTSFLDRRTLRIAHENDHFDVDHYLHLILLGQSKKSLKRALLDLSASNEGCQQGDIPSTTRPAREMPDRSIHFTDQEREDMRQLQRREVLGADIRRSLIQTLDIICAFLYENRSTEGEFNVESGWTIRTLSSVLSFLDDLPSPFAVLETFARRSISYPLYRWWPLTTAVIDDLHEVLLLGKSAILQCLLGVRRIFSQDDVRYVLNDIFINDLCVWFQTIPTHVVDRFAMHVINIDVTKDMTKFPIEEIETLLQEEED
eukprot:gene8752-1135_t